MSSNQGKIYDLNEAREKIRGYCLYRERSQKEVRDKLLSYGLFPEIADTLLSELILERFVDEERFAGLLCGVSIRLRSGGGSKSNRHYILISLALMS